MHCRGLLTEGDTVLFVAKGASDLLYTDKPVRKYAFLAKECLKGSQDKQSKKVSV
jgi:hypothetical protein